MVAAQILDIKMLTVETQSEAFEPIIFSIPISNVFITIKRRKIIKNNFESQ